MVLALKLIHDLLYFRGITFCQLDGSMKLEDRQQQVTFFTAVFYSLETQFLKHYVYRLKYSQKIQLFQCFF